MARATTEGACRDAPDAPASGLDARLVGWLAAAFLASGAVLAVAEWMAARGDTSAHFYVFWAGYALAVAPAAWALVRRGSTPGFRSTLVVALAVWSLAPILLRTGDHPLFFDEFSHLRMLEDLVRTGHPVSSTGLLQIGASFPGLELATSALYHLSGLTLWLAALVVAAVAHVALLAGVYVLVRDAASSARAGAIASVAYALNPSWLFFDAQFSYETLALPMLVWALVFALRSARRVPDRSAFPRGVQLALAALLTASLVVTHHVTSVVNVAALLVVAIVATLQRRGVLRSDVVTSPAVAWSLAAFAGALTAWRFVDVGRPLVVYLGPTFHLSKELTQLLGLLGIGPGLAAHGAFASSTAPLFERVCAFAMVPILLVAFVWAAWGLVSVRRGLSPIAYAAVLLGALFFASLPLATAQAYAEAAHRSWAFSFLGLAIVLGLAGDAALEGRLSVTVRRRHLWPTPARLTRALGPAVAACTAVVAIGGVSVGTATSYRFGGTVAPGIDPLYVGTQTQMVASWFARHATGRDVVFGNRYVVRPIAVASPILVAKPGGHEVLLLLSPEVPRSALLAFVRDRVTYIVFDRRTGRVDGVAAWSWYVSSATLLPKDARHHVYGWRLSCLNWAAAVFATTDYEVLAVSRSALLADLADGVDGVVKGCTPTSAP